VRSIMNKISNVRSYIFAQTRRLARDASGASAIEYAMIAAGIAVVIAGTVVSLGVTAKGMYDTIVSVMK